MTHQYQQEDSLPDTPTQIVANYEAQVNSLDALVTKTADNINAIEQNLGWLYNEAETRGDENAKLAITNAFELAKENATMTMQFDAVRISSVAMLRHFNQLHRKLAGEYDDLQDAIAERDEDNPQLAGYARAIRGQAWEDMQEIAYEDAYDDAHEAVFGDVMMEFCQRMHEITGIKDFGASNRLSNIVIGMQDPTPEQTELLKKLMQTCAEAEAKAS